MYTHSITVLRCVTAFLLYRFLALRSRNNLGPLYDMSILLHYLLLSLFTFSFLKSFFASSSHPSEGLPTVLHLLVFY
jgi:hypothetical protein